MASRWLLRARRRQRIVPLTALATTMALTIAAPAIAVAAAPAQSAPLAGSTQPVGLPSPVPPAVSAAMQRDLHLDPRQIPNHLARQAAAPGIEQSLRTTLGARFGGVWLSEDGTLNAGVTTGTAPPVVKTAGAIPRTVAYSERQLAAAMTALNRHAGDVPDAVREWYVDLPTNRIVITVQPGHTGDGQAFRTRAGVRAEMVRVVTRSLRPQPTRDLYGGDGYHPTGVGSLCSVGFAVSGGFVTAGHCKVSDFFAIEGPGNLPLGSWGGASFPGVDYAWIKTGAFYTVLPEVDVLGPVAGSRQAVVGTAVCHSGATTGVHCGRILSNDYTADYKAERPFDPEGKVEGLILTSACGAPGDSGGPFMAGDQAQGVASGGSGDCGDADAQSYIQPLNPILSAYGLTLKTMPANTPWWDRAPGNSDRATISVDVNGDHRDDVVAFYDYGNSWTKAWVFLANESGGFGASTMAWDSAPGKWDLNRAQLVGGDFDHNGVADVAAFYDYGFGQTKLHVFYSRGDGRFAVPDAGPVAVWDSGPGNWYAERARIVSGDFDGNHVVDVAALYDELNGRTKLWVFRATHVQGYFDPPVMTWDSGAQGWNIGSTRMVAGDFNGDHRGDIGAMYDLTNDRTQLWTFLADPSGKLGAPHMVWDSGAPDSGVGNWALNGTRLVAGDFDHDERDDIGAFYDCGNAETKLWVFTANTTGGFHTPKMNWDSGPGAWNFSNTRLVGGDFNGDLRGDIAAWYDYGNAQTKLWVLTADSTGALRPPVMKWDSGPGGWNLDNTALV